MEKTIKEILALFYQQDVMRYEEGEDIPEILKRLINGELNPVEIRRLIIIRCELAHFFEDQLRQMIATIREESISQEHRAALLNAVEQNLKEELGQIPQYGQPHREDRKIFLSKLGVNYEDWTADFGTYEKLGNLHTATKFLLLATRALISYNPIAAVTILWYWEHRLSRGGFGEFFIFLDVFEKQFPELKQESYKEGDTLWWIYSHADHDTYHAELAADALIAVNADSKYVAWLLLVMDDIFESYWSLIAD